MRFTVVDDRAQTDGRARPRYNNGLSVPPSFTTCRLCAVLRTGEGQTLAPLPIVSGITRSGNIKIHRENPSVMDAI
jgi:hypothetical protein